MTKKQARKRLEKYFNDMGKRTGRVDFPIVDVTVSCRKYKGVLHSWSFKGLIKKAYDL